MSVLAWRKPAPAASSFDPDDDEAEEEEFFAGERICEPTTDTRGRSALHICVVVLMVAGGWWLLKNPGSWQGWLSTKLATASALMEYKAADPVSPAIPSRTSAPEAAPSTDTAPTLAPTPPTTVAATEPTTPASPPPTTVIAHPTVKEFSVAPIEPPSPDLSDPYRARAAAAGLHTNLSRVLLARLSQADYSNARTAIDTAIAKTPDGGTLVWPPQRRPELALFQVRFVLGAAPNCRRYVVTITKDRWSTTSPPMERCGANLGSAHK